MRAIDAYFAFCHRQPIWLFDDKDGLLQDHVSTEIISAILALVMHYGTVEHQLGLPLEPMNYASLARKQIMLHVAEGCVTLATMQALCLLAFANFVGTVPYPSLKSHG